MDNLDYKVCNRCVMDSSILDITFDESGNCNYCLELINVNKKNIEQNLDSLIEKIKIQGKNKQYDCVVGLSGGVDSAYTLIKVLEYGLRPLAVHMDNGWNTELAQNNIYNLVSGLNVDLYTEVLDWEVYSSLMRSFFKSDVVDVELLYDNAMFYSNFTQANKYNIKYILAGTNNSTEGMRIPSSWNWYKYDKLNIKSINNKFENINLKNYPLFSTIDYIFYRFFKKIRWISFLDYLDYNKKEAEKILEQKYNFKVYKYKHYESFFTRFYQGYILPEKFNIDKRKVHLSSLIISNQIDRNHALKTLKVKPYNEDTIKNDIEYFLDKMDLKLVDFENYLKRFEKKHNLYKNELYLWNFASKLYKIIK